jgi:ACS family glucarate transporter-like MFS transporter
MGSERNAALIVSERRVTEGCCGRGRSFALMASTRFPWAKIFRSKAILALAVSYFSFGYVAWMFFAWLYIYMAQVRGLNLKTSAIYSMFPFIAMTAGCLLGGVVSDWIAARYGLRKGRCLLPGLRSAASPRSAPTAAASPAPRQSRGWTATPPAP